MSWPTDGEEGWEVFGTEIDEDPEEYLLPERESAWYDDPIPLDGIGVPATFVAREFAGGTCRAVRRLRSVEAELRMSYVYGAVLLDSLLVPDVGAPCSVVVTVYLDDRETEWFSVGTDPAHPKPYLVEPDRYGEQEIDVAAGAATIGTVQVVIIDPPRTIGDQNTGSITRLLGIAGFGNIQGRRCLVKRFISEELGYQVLADGPAGAPRMDSSFAAYSFDVRDTRETERKIRAFEILPNQNLLPEGNGYGFNPDSNTWLIDPPFAGTGTVFQEVTERKVVFDIDGNYTISLEAYLELLKIVPGGRQAWHPYAPGTHHPAHYKNKTRIVFQWRIKDSADPWTYITKTLWLIPLNSSDPQNAEQEIHSIVLESPDNPALLPDDSDVIEFLITGPIPPSEGHPGYVEGLTAGELARNLYDGRYSRPDNKGHVQSTGIQYDEAALLQMTTPVRLRLTEPIADARDWLEKFIYQPTGWVPALDQIGRIAPVSQVAPDSGLGLPAITNDITEAAPEWNAGERIVNIVRFTYPRDYVPDDDTETALDGIASREVVREYRDPLSIDRSNEQVVDIDGSAFRALGDPDGNPQPGDPLHGGIPGFVSPLVGEPNEVAKTLADARWLHLSNRYAYGAPTMRVNVMREALPLLRCGDWVVLDLTWFPDYITRKRGLIAMAQVVAIADLDCAWRGVTVEVVNPIVEDYS